MRITKPGVASWEKVSSSTYGSWIRIAQGSLLSWSHPRRWKWWSKTREWKKSPSSSMKRIKFLCTSTLGQCHQRLFPSACDGLLLNCRSLTLQWSPFSLLPFSSHLSSWVDNGPSPTLTSHIRQKLKIDSVSHLFNASSLESSYNYTLTIINKRNHFQALYLYASFMRSRIRPKCEI